MDKFNAIYVNMLNNYNYLERIMFELNNHNPEDEETRELLRGLKIVAQNMISNQIDFTASYGDPATKNALISNLEAKEEVLENSNNEHRKAV